MDRQQLRELILVFDHYFLSKLANSTSNDPPHSIFETLRNEKFAELGVAVSKDLGDVVEVLLLPKGTDQLEVMLLVPNLIYVVGWRVLVAFFSMIVNQD